MPFGKISIMDCGTILPYAINMAAFALKFLSSCSASLRLLMASSGILLAAAMFMISTGRSLRVGPRNHDRARHGVSVRSLLALWLIAHCQRIRSCLTSFS
jgi:hypothetical protein